MSGERPRHPALKLHRGRGAVSNLPGRFQPHHVDPFDDGWGSLDEPVAPLETTVTPECSRTVLTANDSPDVPFNLSINPYRGCEHGCVYCFARPSHAYLDLSPGLDFESRLFCKPDAAALLRKALSRPRYRCEPIVVGANTDAYQPVERRLGITREILETLAEFRQPFSIVTKSNLVLRDLDLIGPAAREKLATVHVSVTTLDRALARKMEPRAPTPSRRVEAIAALTEAGVEVGVMLSPVIPGLNDTEVEEILQAVADAGATRASTIAIRLPHELKQLFTDWLAEHFPDRAAKVLNRIREMRGGKLNDPRFGERMRGSGEHAELLRRRFEVACRRLGLDRRGPDLDTTRFRVPGRGRQALLFP